MANGSVRQIREFIYVDVPKLYSMYSQVFQGVADQIVTERTNQLISGNTQRTILSQAASETEAAEIERRTESGVLHDHMYNRLETELGTALQNAGTIDPAAMHEMFITNPLVKVHGRAEIEDYERMRVTIENFNALAGVIASSQLINSPEVQQERARIEQELERTTNNQRRRQLEAERTRLLDPQRAAQSLGLAQDPQLLSNLTFMGGLFNANGYEVIIAPTLTLPIRYRGVLDRVWLRNDADLIRKLYGGQSEAPWTMVGYVTYVPGTFVDIREQEGETPTLPHRAGMEEALPSLRDPFRNMFRSGRVIERMFVESDTLLEVIMSPIAIYREFEIPIAG